MSQDWIDEHRQLYLSDGEKGHFWDSTVRGGPGPIPTLLLYTTGRKSGKTSIMPLIYGEGEGGYAIIASKGGAPAHPDWYFNLQADPNVQVKLRDETFAARAETVTDERPGQTVGADGQDLAAVQRVPKQNGPPDPRGATDPRLTCRVGNNLFSPA